MTDKSPSGAALPVRWSGPSSISTDSRFNHQKGQHNVWCGRAEDSLIPAGLQKAMDTQHFTYISYVMEADIPAAVRGRPREFCVQGALAAALGVFWSKGYEGASMAELTTAMGITKPSLYAAFGNKEQLFHKALDLYETEKLAYAREALSQRTARAVAEHFMRGAIAAQTSSTDPRGCMGVIHTTACGAEAESIKAEVIKRRHSSAAALLDRLCQAKRDGDLPDNVEPEALSEYLFTILQGMAVQAGAGATRTDLERVLETSLMFWPGR